MLVTNRGVNIVTQLSNKSWCIRHAWQYGASTYFRIINITAIFLFHKLYIINLVNIIRVFYYYYFCIGSRPIFGIYTLSRFCLQYFEVSQLIH